MKITKIETLVCHARMRNWVFVKVYTDQPGLIGWGEATLEWHTRAVVGAVEDLAQLLIGEDPTRVEYLWQVMYRQHFWHGNGAVRGTAIAGIDLALWDILGKVLNAPCHQLWGGRVRDTIRLYCHLGGGKMEDFYETKPDDARRFGELAQQAVADGYTAFKSMAVPEQMPIEGVRPVKYAEACVAAMREAVGDGIDIMVDCHARPSPRMGLIFAKVLEPYNLYFFEEPCWPEHMKGIAEVQRAVKTPIATGERITSFYGFKELFELQAASIVQPDITHCGGLTAARRIAAMAEAYGITVAPHNPQGPVSTAASIEFGLATPNYLICEAVHQDVPWREAIVNWGFRVETKGRLVHPGTRPGLGVEINEEEIRKHPFEQEVPKRAYGRDGSVVDW
ncbi:MAG: galactonate dehydratase [Verrucomicrobiota bacterium]|nr:galactonate dehydratase [Verrucomicrobiota bacterium]